MKVRFQISCVTLDARHAHTSRRDRRQPLWITVAAVALSSGTNSSLARDNGVFVRLDVDAIIVPHSQVTRIEQAEYGAAFFEGSKESGPEKMTRNRNLTRIGRPRTKIALDDSDSCDGPVMTGGQS
jgi:hypothetical protein